MTARTHCTHGHSMADAYTNSNGRRECRTCREDWRRKSRARAQQGSTADVLQRKGVPRPQRAKPRATVPERVAALLASIEREKDRPRPRTTLLTLYRRGLVMELWRGRAG